MANSCNSIPKFISSDKLPFTHARDLIQGLKLRPIHSTLHFRAYASSRKSKRNYDRREEFEDYEMEESRAYASSRKSKRNYDRREEFEDYEMKESRAYASSRKSKKNYDRREEFEDYEIKERRRSEKKERRHAEMNEIQRDRRGRGLITISPAGERWDSKWDSDYVLTLRDLELDYLATDGEQGTEVHISLAYQPHVGFGLSVRGRVTTSFNSECSWCSKIFHKEIDATFDVTVLPEPRESGLLELGGDDSVIYVKYGSEAELDSFIQDKILVEALSQDICSKTCGDTPITLFSVERTNNIPRWPQLLRLKEELLEKETPLDLGKGPDSNSDK